MYCNALFDYKKLGSLGELYKLYPSGVRSGAPIAQRF